MASRRGLRARLWMRRVGAIGAVVGCAIAIGLSTRGTRPPERYTAAQKATEAALNRRLPAVAFDNVPMPDAIASLGRLADLHITLDDSVAPLAAQRLVNRRRTDIYVFKALLSVIREIGLTQDNYLVRPDGCVVVMSTERLAEEAVWREYDLRPLLVAFGQPELDRPVHRQSEMEADLVSVVRETVAPGSWREDGGAIGEVFIEDNHMRVRHLPDEQWQIWSLLDQFLPRDHAMRYLKDRLTETKR